MEAPTQIEVALLACRLLVTAYEHAKQRGDHLDADDVDAAYVAARSALSLPYDPAIECSSSLENSFRILLVSISQAQLEPQLRELDAGGVADRNHSSEIFF